MNILLKPAHITWQITVLINYNEFVTIKLHHSSYQTELEDSSTIIICSDVFPSSTQYTIALPLHNCRLWIFLVMVFEVGIIRCISQACIGKSDSQENYSLLPLWFCFCNSGHVFCWLWYRCTAPKQLLRSGNMAIWLKKSSNRTRHKSSQTIIQDVGRQQGSILYD